MMCDKPIVLVVDDDTFMCQMTEEVLGDNYQVVSVDSGENCLMAARADQPRVILLDVAMPGMDGYETCRRLKEIDETAEIPVIFVSAHDRIEDRIKGYEAGAEDYVVKPSDPQELEAKITNLLKQKTERANLQQMASLASSTAMTAMTNLGEMGAVIESLRNFNACLTFPSLADAVLAGLGLFGLQGVVQLRGAEQTLVRNHQGPASPLEISIIQHMSSMERIMQFKSRLSITYPHCTLLIPNMPLDDPDRCGRLRDHLAMLVEAAEVRAVALLVEHESRQRGRAIECAISGISATLAEFDAAQRQSRAATNQAIIRMTDKMNNVLFSAALSELQDQEISDALKEGVAHIIVAQSGEIRLQERLTNIIHDIETLTPTNS